MAKPYLSYRLKYLSVEEPGTPNPIYFVALLIFCVSLVLEKEENLFSGLFISSRISAYANNIPNPEGGFHLTGFKTVLTRAFNSYAKKNNIIKEKEENLQEKLAGYINILEEKYKAIQIKAREISELEKLLKRNQKEIEKLEDNSKKYIQEFKQAVLDCNLSIKNINNIYLITYFRNT